MAFFGREAVANRVRPIALSAADRAELERVQRASSTPAGLSRRARAVLLMAQGLSGVAIAERIGYTVVQVSRLRRRFAEDGVPGLRERPRSGRPPTITARQRAHVVALTLKPPPAGVTHWTTRDLARKAGVSHTTVHRLWRAHALQPHRLQTFKFSTDPAAEDKIYDVVGLYLNPPINAVVLSLDEKTQIQALSRTQPLLPLRPGLPARQTHDYRRNGLTSLYAALEVASGRVLGECTRRHTGADFLAFLKRITRRYRGRALHIILDNSSTHTTPAVHAWLAAHPDVHFHFTPKGASWLNLVEAWFSILTRKSVRRASFETVRGLVRHIEHYIDEWNSHPTPFVWTKEPADIIKKAVRPVNMTSRTEH
jgi:transposase